MDNLTLYESKLDNIQIDIDYANSGKITNYHSKITNKLVDKARIIFNDDSIDDIRLSRILRIANRLIHPLFNILFNIIDYLDHNDIKNLLLTCTLFNTTKVQSNILEYLKNNFFIYDITFDNPYFILNNYHRKNDLSNEDEFIIQAYDRYIYPDEYELCSFDEYWYDNTYYKLCYQIIINLHHFINNNCHGKLIIFYHNVGSISINAVKNNKYVILKYLLDNKLIRNVRYLLTFAKGRVRELLLTYKYHYICYSKDRPLGEYIDYRTDTPMKIYKRWKKANNLEFNKNKIRLLAFDYIMQNAIIYIYHNIEILCEIINLGPGTNFETIKYGIDTVAFDTRGYKKLLYLSDNVDGMREYLTSSKFFYSEIKLDGKYIMKEREYTYYSYKLQYEYINKNLREKHGNKWWLQYIKDVCKYYTDIKLIDYIVENVEFNTRHINLINKLVEKI